MQNTVIEANDKFMLSDIETTEDIAIPKKPLDMVIGQQEAVEIAKIAAKQHRHMLLVGPPGTGKSMIGQALSLYLPAPAQEIQVVHNPENPERPLVEVKDREKVMSERKTQEVVDGEIIRPEEAPINISEKLGYRCMNCGEYSSPKELSCPRCSKPKSKSQTPAQPSPFNIEIINQAAGLIEGLMKQNARVTTTRKRFGKEEVVVFEQFGEFIKILDQEALEKQRELEKQSPRKILVNLSRTPFVLATGASETELLGDVKHDPYGGHPQLGIPPYERVVPGSVHEAHEGVLFIDELPHLGPLQRYILTAMQERRFPIVGRNPQSSGASVRVDDVPCNFIFIGACNIQDLHHILSPLRSRVIGSGYEVLIETTMDDSDLNTAKMAQFIAQEIFQDGRIPPMSRDGVEEVIEEAKRRAKGIDNKDNALTLRLRDLGGLVRIAGDLAIINRSEIIERKHVVEALKRNKPLEQQIKDKYGSYMSGVGSDISGAQKEVNPYYYWNQQASGDGSIYHG